MGLRPLTEVLGYWGTTDSARGEGVEESEAVVSGDAADEEDGDQQPDLEARRPNHPELRHDLIARDKRAVDAGLVA